MSKQKQNEITLSPGFKKLLKDNGVNLLLFKESLGAPPVAIPEFETLKGGLRAYEMIPEQNSETGQLILKKCREIFDAETANSEMDLTYFEKILMEGLEKLLSYDNILLKKYEEVWHKLASKEIRHLKGFNAYMRIKEIANAAAFGSNLKIDALKKGKYIMLTAINDAKNLKDLKMYDECLKDDVELIEAYNATWDLITDDLITKLVPGDSSAARDVFESAREGSVVKLKAFKVWDKISVNALKGYEDNAEAIYEEIKEMPHHLSAFKEGERLIKEWLEKSPADTERTVEDYLFLFQDENSPLDPEILTSAATVILEEFLAGYYDQQSYK